MINKIQKEFYPEITFLISNEPEKLVEVSSFTKDYKQIGKKTTIYVCENFICQKPTTNIDEALQNMS